MYQRILPNGLTVRSTRNHDAEELEKLQIIVFPTLIDSQRLKADHYKKHIEIFPQGQFVAVDGVRIVGMTTSIRLSEGFLHSPHSFDDVICGGYCSSHDNKGEWLYGVDMGTHQEYRGRGIARALYLARQTTVKDLGLKGQYTVGMINGYADYYTALSVEQYYQKLLAGELKDPTLSAQIKIGFEPNGLMKDYLQDPQCGNCGVRLILPVSKEIGDADSFYR